MKQKTLASLKFLCLTSMFLSVFSACSSDKQKTYTLTPVSDIPAWQWQAERSFPNQNGSIDDTLAMNSMYSFDGYKGQGTLYFKIEETVERFDLFLNNQKIDTKEIAPGSYSLDISELALNGSNTLQLCNIQAGDPSAKVTVFIPYPEVIEGSPADVGMKEAPFRLIEKIISADIANGFSSAQLAVIKDGRLIYQNAWGLLDSYLPDGKKLEEGAPVSNDTLYDLASNTKMYAVVYAFQYLYDQNILSLSDRVVDLLGQEFVNETIEIAFSSFKGDYPGLDMIKEWKASITLKDLLMHQAGFPDSGHYHNEYFDTVNQTLSTDIRNVLYVANADKEKTFREGICRTPLMYEPGTTTRYSDIDYMILGLVIEKVTGKDLDSFLKETYWQPMDLQRITYAPLDHGYNKEDCAATELNGNTRDGLIDFPGIRTETIQGEVHDEESYYMMESMSGHAGLFANATDLAKLAFVMLSGGYGSHRFFSKNTRDLFSSPQAGGAITYGIGWWREADDRRVWYFGTQAPESTIGHQGWTGTLTMIDPINHLIIVYLTNTINTPIYDPTTLEHANKFCGSFYTSSTLGFVPQILYTGLSSLADPEEALDSLIRDMVNEKRKLVEKEGITDPEHPLSKAYAAIRSILEETPGN